MREVKVNGIYKHYKGDSYLVVDIAYDSETNNDEEPKKLVIYRALYGDNRLWARPYDMFLEEVNKDGHKYRFELQEIKSVRE